MYKKESETGRYIYITPTYKVINPTHLGTLYKYSGNIDGYDFKNQRKNLEQIQAVLEKPLTYIYVGKFMGEKDRRLVFLARDEEGMIWWRKGEGNGENWIYEGSERYNLKKWLKRFNIMKDNIVN